MNKQITKIGNVWMPSREHHMIGFLTDPARMVDGVGTYQLHKIRRVLEEMKKRKPRMFRAIDVGSHVGTWTRFLAKEFQFVECFEPHPVHRECWLKNMGEWNVKNADLHACALGEVATGMSLFSNPESSGDTWLDDGAEHSGYEKIEDIAVETLDSFGFMGVDLIKIDCEGGELGVLRGAAKMIERQKPMICVEQKPGRAEKYGLPRTGACSYLESLGAKRLAEMSGDYLYAWD